MYRTTDDTRRYQKKGQHGPSPIPGSQLVERRYYGGLMGKRWVFRFLRKAGKKDMEGSILNSRGREFQMCGAANEKER